jgi:hypothetical protein
VDRHNWQPVPPRWKRRPRIFITVQQQLREDQEFYEQSEFLRLCCESSLRLLTCFSSGHFLQHCPAASIKPGCILKCSTRSSAQPPRKATTSKASRPVLSANGTHPGVLVERCQVDFAAFPSRRSIPLQRQPKETRTCKIVSSLGSVVKALSDC